MFPIFQSSLSASHTKTVEENQVMIETLNEFALQCKIILLRTLHVIPCVESLQTIEVMDGGNTIPLLSYLIQTYFIYPANKANSDLLLELVACNAEIGNAIVQSSSSSGKYLLQVTDRDCLLFVDLLQIPFCSKSKRIYQSEFCGFFGLVSNLL